MPRVINFGAVPWATFLAVLITLVLGVNHVIDQAALSFDEYITYVTVVWSFLAVGRGLALKEETVETTPFLRFLNTFPWATVIVGIVAVVGYIGTLSDSLTIEELGLKLAILIGALGLGRGLGVLKKDIMSNKVVTNITNVVDERELEYNEEGFVTGASPDDEVPVPESAGQYGDGPLNPEGPPEGAVGGKVGEETQRR